MQSAPPGVLILAPAAVIRQLGSILAQDVASVGAESYEEAVRKLGEMELALLIVCYAFDEVRPFRVLNYLRQEWEGVHLPTMLVRALPVPLAGAEEAAIRESYARLGVDEFFNLHHETQRVGWEAASARFRESAVALLSPRRRRQA